MKIICLRFWSFDLLWTACVYPFPEFICWISNLYCKCIWGFFVCLFSGTQSLLLVLCFGSILSASHQIGSRSAGCKAKALFLYYHSSLWDCIWRWAWKEVIKLKKAQYGVIFLSVRNSSQNFYLSDHDCLVTVISTMRK